MPPSTIIAALPAQSTQTAGEPEHWPSPYGASPGALAGQLLRLARNINPRQVAASKRSAKAVKPKPYVNGATARAHVATARVLIQARAERPWKGCF